MAWTDDYTALDTFLNTLVGQTPLTSTNISDAITLLDTMYASFIAERGAIERTDLVSKEAEIKVLLDTIKTFISESGSAVVTGDLASYISTLSTLVAQATNAAEDAQYYAGQAQFSGIDQVEVDYATADANKGTYTVNDIVLVLADENEDPIGTPPVVYKYNGSILVKLYRQPLIDAQGYVSDNIGLTDTDVTVEYDGANVDGVTDDNAYLISAVNNAKNRRILLPSNGSMLVLPSYADGSNILNLSHKKLIGTGGKIITNITDGKRILKLVDALGFHIQDLYFDAQQPFDSTSANGANFVELIRPKHFMLTGSHVRRQASSFVKLRMDNNGTLDPLSYQYNFGGNIVAFNLIEQYEQFCTGISSVANLFIGNQVQQTENFVKFDAQILRTEARDVMYPLPFLGGMGIALANNIYKGSSGNAEEDEANPSAIMFTGEGSTATIAALNNVYMTHNKYPFHFHGGQTDQPGTNGMLFGNNVSRTYRGGMLLSAWSPGSEDPQYTLQTQLTASVPVTNVIVNEALVETYVTVPFEYLGTGNGASKTLNFTTANVPRPGTAYIFDGIEEWVDPLLDGNLVGDRGSTGTISYVTGAISLIYHATERVAVSANAMIWCSYNYEDGFALRIGNPVTVKNSQTDLHTFYVSANVSPGAFNIPVTSDTPTSTFIVGQSVYVKKNVAKNITIANNSFEHGSRGAIWFRLQAPMEYDGVYIHNNKLTDWSDNDYGAAQDTPGGTYHAAIHLKLFGLHKDIILNNNVLRLTKSDGTYSVDIDFLEIQEDPNVTNGKIHLYNETYINRSTDSGAFLIDLTDVTHAVVKDSYFEGGTIRNKNSLVYFENCHFVDTRFTAISSTYGNPIIICRNCSFTDGSKFNDIANVQNGMQLTLINCTFTGYADSSPWNMNNGNVTVKNPDSLHSDNNLDLTARREVSKELVLEGDNTYTFKETFYKNGTMEWQWVLGDDGVYKLLDTNSHVHISLTDTTVDFGDATNQVTLRVNGRNVLYVPASSISNLTGAETLSQVITFINDNILPILNTGTN